MPSQPNEGLPVTHRCGSQSQSKLGDRLEVQPRATKRETGEAGLRGIARQAEGKGEGRVDLFEEVAFILRAQTSTGSRLPVNRDFSLCLLPL